MSKPMSNFNNRDTPNLSGWSLAPDSHHHADNRDSVSEAFRDEIAASKWAEWAGPWAPVKYPAVVRDDPGSWPVAWGGLWGGE